MTHGLGQRIADAVVAEFNKHKSGKPVLRSNGVQEWTVLAGIVAIVGDSIVPLTMATGVKTLPDKVRAYSKGLFVHDMHAEILAIRLFNWWLLNEADEISKDKPSELVERDGEKFTIKPGVKLGLYISEPPCGDASMGYISGDSTPWKSSKSSKQSLDGEVNKVLEDGVNTNRSLVDLEVRKSFEDGEVNTKRSLDMREASAQGISDDVQIHKRSLDDGVVVNTKRVNRGRGHYDRLGVVRTKPGRSDSLVSYSKSCSDKLCLQQLTGLNNAFTASLFPKIHLNYLVLRHDKYHQSDLDRCFLRLKGHDLEILSYNRDEYKYHKLEKSIKSCPSELSIIKVIPSDLLEVLNNGVKNGSYRKNAIPKKNGASFVCNYAMYQKFTPLLESSESYLNFKNLNKPRQQLKSEGWELLGDWKRTGDDDFVMNNVNTA